MPRSRTDVAALVQEARAMEMLASEAEIAPQDLQEYWNISGELVNTVSDIEQLQLERPNATYEDPELLMLKRRLRELAGRLGAIAD